MRKISESLNIPMQQVLVAAGYLKPEETGVVEVVSTKALTNDQLLTEIASRLVDDKPEALTSVDQAVEVDEKQSDYDLVSNRKGETAERRRRRLEGDFEDHPQGEGPEFGA